ncbi:MAG: glutamate synthase large subunit [Campylobacteraceae bacterium]|nr:glutamate synthase large subunit [Campylobacteraceae bacterium]
MGNNVKLLTSFKDNCGFGLMADLKNRPSHNNLEDAITSLERMMHRGAVAADGKTGDGSGLLMSIPEKFMRKITSEEGIDLPENYGIAMIFTEDLSDIEIFKGICENNDLKILYTREVPINKDALGAQALACLPYIIQVFVAANSLMSSKRLDAMLYLTRKECEHQLLGKEEFYIPSFSSRVISYKGLIMPTHIKQFYVDFNDEDFAITFALFHQRFSTNTLPQWRLAQPFRTIAHNGEINSVEANRVNVRIKSEKIESEVFTQAELNRLFPILQEGGSDSASLDNMFEFLLVNGCDFFKAARSLIPAPWQNAPHMDPELRAFYEYTSTAMEAWDGPAAVSLTDGRYIGCLIDRNGLRPSKYVITKDHKIYITSEYGTIDFEEENIKERGRLQSGEMIGLDLKHGVVLKENDINDYLKSSQNYSKWLNNDMEYLQEYIDESFLDISDYTFDDLENRQKFYNITYEAIDQMIEPMSKDGKEPVGSMGDDTPLACFSEVNRNFTDFFRQKFAQVTNPPIDPYREKVVMSLETGFGQIHNILDEKSSYAKRLKVTSPILMQEKYNVLVSFGEKSSPRYDKYYKNQRFSTTFKTGLKEALENLAKEVIYSIVNNDVYIILLDDRAVSKDNKIIPMAMVVGYLNQALLKAKIRHSASFIAVSGEVYDPHMAAVLLAYGVTAIYPYMMYASTVALHERRLTNKYDMQKKLKNTQKALNGGLLKIMSKMGICTIASYRNSALFDLIGLSDEILEDCFDGSFSDLAGLGYEDIEKRIEKSHFNAYYDDSHMFPLDLGGFYKYIDGGEYHDYGPNTLMAMHNKKAKIKEDITDFDALRELVEKRDKKFIRDFFEFNSDKKAIPLEKVESLDEIFKRFASAAMSLGSISPEAHEAMAITMNTIGGMSNSGEGGEDPKRFGTLKNSKIKQVASGRFGVTPGYLRSAEEIQIKVAQGAKPGEGGQLAGHKVTAYIAGLRHTVEGVTLISPPPHHDIYSIEDLSQLIFDLKQINPEAKITVKLVSTVGVGTIAAGVAKAYADRIVISGADGGTGAAPLTSLKHTGNPWEMGLTEAHNALKANHLRGSVHLQTDGGLKTGLDVIKAAMLGAESYAFGTAALTLLGCKILRICHTNKCSVGVATQDEDLRTYFTGTVERLISYFSFIASDVRDILAKLGYSSIEEIVGRSDLLKVIDDKMAQKFDFSNILRRIDGVDTCQKERNVPYDKNKFEKELLKKVHRTIENPSSAIKIKVNICNTNRSFGTLISGEIAKYYGDKGLPDNSINIHLKGTAGQSFGAFLSKGMNLFLDGPANDYIGKGMNGGKIIINPFHQGEEFAAGGNTCLYGATGGKLYIRACVGERFAVRNSGAVSVVEGTGDNACEYMTGGIVVTLGNTGINFGAGMTGGLAFIYDPEKSFVDKMNQELVEALRIDTDDTERERLYLKRLLLDYINETESLKAQDILENYRAEIRNFWMVKPKNMTVLPLDPDEGD